MKNLQIIVIGLCALFLFVLTGEPKRAAAAELRIGVVNMQKVVNTSKAGKKAQSVLEQKMKTYEASFKKERASLLSMRDEIDKKASAWSDSVKQQKIAEFQKRSAEFSAKEKEANQEMRKLQEKHVQPVLEKLEGIIDDIGRSGRYDLIMPKNMVLFSADSVDITAEVIQALDAAMK